MMLWDEVDLLSESGTVKAEGIPAHVWYADVITGLVDGQSSFRTVTTLKCIIEPRTDITRTDRIKWRGRTYSQEEPAQTASKRGQDHHTTLELTNI